MVTVPWLLLFQTPSSSKILKRVTQSLSDSLPLPLSLFYFETAYISWCSADDMTDPTGDLTIASCATSKDNTTVGYWTNRPSIWFLLWARRCAVVASTLSSSCRSEIDFWQRKKSDKLTRRDEEAREWAPTHQKKTRKRRIHYTFSNRRIGNDFPVDRTCNCAGVRHAFSLERDADTLDVGALSGTRGHHLSGSARWKKKSHRRDWQGAARTDVQTLQPNNRAARGASKRPKSKKIAPW